jgi:hypothetical protein
MINRPRKKIIYGLTNNKIHRYVTASPPALLGTHCGTRGTMLGGTRMPTPASSPLIR